MIVRLFNVTLDTDIFPEQWSVGNIKPLYKNTGAKDNPNNCRGITILSCLGKLFSIFLNSRLLRFVEVKLLKCNILGKIFRAVYNMYKSAKSCVAINGLLTDNFSCLIGVRQGENLSPLLFSLYLNDLQQFFARSAHGFRRNTRFSNTHF